MHRTQIYIDDSMFEQIKRRARILGISASAYIREVVKSHLEESENMDHTRDFTAFKGLWRGRDIDLTSIRDKAWR
jgi:predicted DNA-binding protein